MNGPPKTKKEVPTLEQFAPRFLDGHARANQQKPGGIAHKETMLNIHLIPAFGQKRLDTISTEDVQRLKQRLADRRPKTVNNVLTVLNTLLKKAVEWDVIDRMPCTIRLLKTSPKGVGFHDFAEYERLVSAAKKVGSTEHLIVLLGGDAGLRAGEMRALSWTDVDLEQAQLRIERSEFRGEVTSTKGGRIRYVPMTNRLREALRAHRHLRSRLVLYRPDGSPMTESALRESVARVARRADVASNGPHRLRHSFCSRLAMLGAAPRAIQELAGHQSVGTTQRYMHLSPAAAQSAIRLLEQGASTGASGDIVETETGAIENVNR